MSLNFNSRIEQVFDLLTEKQFEIGDDPELAALHTEASRHFYAAVDYNRKDYLEVNRDYELDQVRNALDTFENVKNHDKGI
jgi:hypothetical protein